MIYQWLITAIVFLIPMLAGVTTLGYLKLFRDPILRIGAGSTLGIATFGTIVYALAHFTHTTPTVVWTILVLFFIESIAMLFLPQKERIQNTISATTAILFLTLCALFAIIAPKLLIEKEDGLYTGIINAYGDIAWHTSLITELARQQHVPIQDPIFAGVNLTYPYLANFISAGAVIIGASLPASVDVPAMLFLPITVILLYFLGLTYGKSRHAGIITMLLFLFGGATFGWLRVVPDFFHSNVSLFQFLTHLPNQDYSGVGNDPNGFHFLNPVTSLLLPQRALLFGIPIALSVLLLLAPSYRKNKYSPILAGVLAGMLPLFHAHACIALASAITALIAIYPNKRYWISFFIPAIIIGIPELTFYLHGHADSGSFFRFAPWWTAEHRNIFIFWIQNTGIIIPAILGSLYFKTPKQAKALAWSGIFLFILANTFLFAPWTWDNFKILVFWYIFSLPAIAWLYVFFWNHSKHVIYKLILLFILSIQIFAGSLDIWKLALPTAQIWQEWSAQSIVFAQYITKYVPKDSPIATASVHNSPVALAGGLMYLGYPAHVWSHGVSPWAREAEVKAFYSGDGNKINDTIPKYIVIGPQELSAFPTLHIQEQWQVVAQYGPYTLFRQ